MDYPISAVENIIKETGRPITRHWLQQLKKRMKLWGKTYPVIEGKGRHGDRFPLTTICQIALHYDLTRQIETHQEAWSKITFNKVTAEMFSESLAHAVLATGFHSKVNVLSLLKESRKVAIPTYKPMALAVIFDASWNFDFKYLWREEHFEELRKRIEWESRVTVICNMSLISWQVAAAVREVI